MERFIKDLQAIGKTIYDKHPKRFRKARPDRGLPLLNDLDP